jgi:hypothetical protein
VNRLVTAAPALTLLAALAVAAIWAIAHSIRSGRHVPAAPDNRPGIDSEALITCRRISRQPLTDPEIARRAHHYLRRKEGDQP